MNNKNNISAKEALKMLADGNNRYVGSAAYSGDVSDTVRTKTAKEGQFPFAVIISCSDSRVIPEVIFDAGIGELFVIRVAGNVIDKHQLGSIEYAVAHLGCKLVAVLGHTHCGAVAAALGNDPDGHIKFLTDEIKKAVGSEKDEDKACLLNVRHSVSVIESDIDIHEMEAKDGLVIIGAVYDTESGKVTFADN